MSPHFKQIWQKYHLLYLNSFNKAVVHNLIQINKKSYLKDFDVDLVCIVFSSNLQVKKKEIFSVTNL